MRKLKTIQSKQPHKKQTNPPPKKRRRRRRKNKTKTNKQTHKIQNKTSKQTSILPRTPARKKKEKKSNLKFRLVTAFFPDAFVYEYLEVGHIKCVPNPFNRHFNIRCSIIVSKKLISTEAH